MDEGRRPQEKWIFCSFYIWTSNDLQRTGRELCVDFYVSWKHQNSTFAALKSTGVFSKRHLYVRGHHFSFLTVLLKWLRDFNQMDFLIKKTWEKHFPVLFSFLSFRYLFWHSMGYQFSVQKMHERAALVINYKVHHLSPKCLFALKSAYFVSWSSMRPLIWILSFNCHHQIWK